MIRWVKDPQRQVSQPDEPEWKPSFNEQIQAVREILDGNPAEARDDHRATGSSTCTTEELER